MYFDFKSTKYKRATRIQWHGSLMIEWLLVETEIPGSNPSRTPIFFPLPRKDKRIQKKCNFLNVPVDVKSSGSICTFPSRTVCTALSLVFTSLCLELSFVV